MLPRILGCPYRDRAPCDGLVASRKSPQPIWGTELVGLLSDLPNLLLQVLKFRSQILFRLKSDAGIVLMSCGPCT